VLVYIDNPDALHSESSEEGIFSDEGSESSSEVDNSWYACREFEVIDHDGHHIMFAKDLSDPSFGYGMAQDRGRG